MHELSIVQSVVETVLDWLRAQPPLRVKAVNLRVGALSAVVEDALQFGWEIAAKDTQLEGSTLVVHEVNIVLYCMQCQKPEEVEGTQFFRCPNCGTPSNDLRQGREIEIESLEIEDEA
ncbi:MAG: hydrogenase maturation nickel metallochaperone HypA [Acidobacteriota bacterium]|nr:hydrogenase maturation nickel metallochaperone HypA [Acidobacteriota bacterium]